MKASLALSLLLAGLVLLIASPTQAKAKIDGRKHAAKLYIDCVGNKKCDPTRAMIGPALKYYKESANKRSRYKVLSWKIITLNDFPAKARSRWIGRWSKLIPGLVKAGYRAAALKQFGAQKGLVNIKPTLALALVMVTLRVAGREKPEIEGIHLVIARDKNKRYTWRVEYGEDSLSSISRHLLQR